MNLIDRVIGYINPKYGLSRVKNRALMLSVNEQVRRYEGAAEGRRHSNWLMKNNPSVKLLIQKDLKNLIARSRELSINNPYAKSAPAKIANSVVGTGIIPAITVKDILEKGKVKKVPNKEKVAQIAQTAWAEWANELTCDYNNDYNFYGLQHLIIRTVITSGEMLVLRKRVTPDQNKYGFQILLLEGDYIDTSKNTTADPDGGYTFYGIKYDKANKRAGYWIYDRHPSEGNPTSILVPIQDIIHVLDVERAGQARGVPTAASTILRQKDIDEYEDAELLGKKTSACFPIFVENSDPEGQDQNERVESIEPGMINYLNANEKVTFATPPISNGYAEFVKSQQRGIANGYMLSYEMYTNDYSNVNFSSGRMGWIEFQRQVYYWQYLMLIPKFCDKAFSWFVEGLQISHSIDKKIEIKATWTAPRREMIDPVKETNAKRTAIRAGLTSWQETVRQDGYNPEEVLKEMKQDQEAFIAAGLTPDSNQYFEISSKIQKEAKE
jgi:lambda family phage portal protein